MLSTDRVRVFEIYDCIQGESTLAGMPCTLVRLAGCPLDCSYCDTPEAIPPDSGAWMTISDIAADVAARGRPLTLVSGGEPLAQKHCGALLDALSGVAPLLQLETSGALDISRLNPKVRRILDIKTPGSGEQERNLWDNLDALKSGDELKFVLCGEADYGWALDVLAEHGRRIPADVPILFSPVEPLFPAAELAARILRDGAPVRLQIQMHKHVWGAEAKGV